MRQKGSLALRLGDLIVGVNGCESVPGSTTGVDGAVGSSAATALYVCSNDPSIDLVNFFHIRRAKVSLPCCRLSSVSSSQKDTPMAAKKYIAATKRFGGA